MASSSSLPPATLRPTVAAPRPLLALRRTTAYSRAGLAPHCAVTVRMLDRVFFAVRAGECVVVQHRDPAGVRVLMAALAGVVRHPAITVTGARVVRAGVRVRRASIRADLVPTLVAAWRSRTVRPDASAIPAVHLLRASRHGASDARAHQAWSDWAAAQHAAGGALVIVSDADGSDVPASAVGGRAPTEVHESSRAYLVSNGKQARTAGAVRACRLRHGRIAVASAPSSASAYCWPSDAPEVLGP